MWPPKEVIEYNGHLNSLPNILITSKKGLQFHVNELLNKRNMRFENKCSLEHFRRKKNLDLIEFLCLTSIFEDLVY